MAQKPVVYQLSVFFTPHQIGSVLLRTARVDECIYFQILTSLILNKSFAGIIISSVQEFFQIVMQKDIQNMLSPDEVPHRQVNCPSRENAFIMRIFFSLSVYISHIHRWNGPDVLLENKDYGEKITFLKRQDRASFGHYRLHKRKTISDCIFSFSKFLHSV